MRVLRGRNIFFRLAVSALLVAAAASPAAARPLLASAAENGGEGESSDTTPPEDSPFGPPVEIEEEHVRKLSVTFSPIHLALPFLEVTGELRVGPDLGIAVIAGMGTIKAEGSDDRFKIYEIGGQARYYVYGSFTKGVMVGIEAIYLAAYDETGSATIKGEGVTLGGYGGYKRVISGFTIDLQLGAQVVAVRTATDEESEAGALVNINFGYTF